MDEFIFSKASREDFGQLKDFMLLALQEDPSAFGSSFEEYNRNSEYWWLSYLEPYISGNRDVMFLVKRDNKILAMSGILYNSQERKKHSALIAWVYVAKDSRRKGLASKLMDQILVEAKNKGGIIKLLLYVNNTQQEALNFYNKLGFSISGSLKKDLLINGEYIDTNIMELFI